MSERSRMYEIRRWIGGRTLPLFAWMRRREVAEIHAELAEYRRLCSEWHRLADLDHKAGVRYDDPNGAGHIAYEAMEREVERLRDVPIPNAERWYGYAKMGGGLTCCVPNYSGLCDSLHGWERPAVPLTRRQAYFVMGWRYEAPPTEEELESMRRMMRAMERVDTTPYTTTTGKLTSVFLGREYFEELVANLHEDEADTRDAP